MDELSFSGHSPQLGCSSRCLVGGGGGVGGEWEVEMDTQGRQSTNMQKNGRCGTKREEMVDIACSTVMSTVQQQPHQQHCLLANKPINTSKHVQHVQAP